MRKETLVALAAALCVLWSGIQSRAEAESSDANKEARLMPVPKYGKVTKRTESSLELDLRGVFEPEIKKCSDRYGKSFKYAEDTSERGRLYIKSTVDPVTGLVTVTTAATLADETIEEIKAQILEACK
jgi:hypothetical protein